MNELSTKIAELYRSGLSVKQISDSLGMGMSKVRYSLVKQAVQFRGHSESSRLLHITKHGKREFLINNSLSVGDENLRIAGTMLYWGEGTKSGNSVVFSNSDPHMIIVFLQFLRNICGINEKRLRILLHIYSDQDEMSLKKYWSSCTNIPIDQFSKTFVHGKKLGTYKKTSQFGTASLRYSDKKLLTVIINWIGQYKMPM